MARAIYSPTNQVALAGSIRSMEASRNAVASERRLEFGAEFEVEMLTNIRAELDRHANECPRTPKVILLNPANHELLGWDEVLGLAVLPSDRTEPMRARLVCGPGRAGRCAEGDVVWDENGQAYVFTPGEHQPATSEK